MSEYYKDAIVIVAKLIAENKYDYEMSGGMGISIEHADPAKILAEIYNRPLKKVSKRLRETIDRCMKVLYKKGKLPK